MTGSRGSPGSSLEERPLVEWPDASIVAVDDVSDYLELLERLLGRAGYTAVRTTIDPRQLLEWYRAAEPDLVVVDLHMAGIDGFQLIRELRSLTPDDHHVPILALTADRDPGTRRRALQLGAHDFLDKVLDETEVSLRIRNLLRTRAQHLQLRRRGRRLEDEVDARDADLELYRRILETIDDAVLIEDPGTGQVVYVNSALGNGAIGRHRDGTVWTAGGLRPLAAEVLSGEVASVSFEGRLERSGSGAVPVDVVVQSLHHRGRRLLVAVARDVSAREEAGRALQRALERERDAADHLRRLDDLKNSLLSAVNHELRTPLTSIVGVAKTLHGRPVDDELLAVLTPLLVRNADELQRLLDDLLDVDRVMNGTAGFAPARTDVRALVREVLDSTDLGRREIVVDLSPAEAVVDPVKFERIVSNLLRNAARHTPDDATVRIRLSGKGTVRLTVADNGPGVPDDLKRSIFEPFVQGELRDPHQPGTGVGLSLVRTFAELHGGRAWVEEVPGGGAAFHVEFPAGGPPVP